MSDRVSESTSFPSAVPLTEKARPGSPTAGRSRSDEVTAAEPVSLEDLRVFLVVVQTGSFRSAAALMFTSQPTLSRAIARLESRLGVRLLERGARGIKITHHGEALVDGARRVLAAAADLRRNVTDPGATTLRLGATATSARSRLTPFLSHWIPAHPEIRLTAVEDSEGQLHARLERGECDVAIVYKPTSSALDSLHVATSNVVALFPPSHPLSGGDGPVTVLDLADEPLLVNGPTFRSTALLDQAMDMAGISPHIAYRSSLGQTLAAMAEAGLGVAIFGGTVDLRGFDLRPRPLLDGRGAPLQFDLYIAWARDVAQPWMKDFAVELATFHRTSRPAVGRH